MAEVRYKEEKLKSLFNNKRGNNKYTKKYCNSNKGKFEVYTGTTIGSFGFIDTYDYDARLLTYTTDGENAGTIKILSGKYNVGGHRAILIPKDNSIVIDYIKWTLQKVFFDNVKKGNVPSLTWSMIKDLTIMIPIDCKGNYDVQKQKEIVKKYEILEAKKKELKEKIDYFKDVQVDFMTLEISKFKEYKVSEIFNTSLSDGKYTKSYTTKNIGKFPLYSGQTDGEYANINSYDYDGSYLTWAKVGLAGYIMHHDNEKFSITNNRGILLLKDKYNNLNLEFLKILLEPIFRKNIKGRLGTQEKNEYTTLSKEMILNIKDKLIIPINNDGTFDIEKQKEIVRKYKVIEEMKKSILEKSLPFTLSNVQFDGETPYIYIRVSDLFEIQRGKSIYTKTYCKNNNGEYPVYSADNKNPLGYRNDYDYKGKFLTSSMNGIAGVLTILDEKFSVNADRVVFVPKVKEISLEYIKNILEPILRNKTKGRKGLKGKNEFTKLTPSMIEESIIPIPYFENGEIFVKKLKEISKKYYTIEKIQKQLEVKIDELLRMEIKF